MSCACARAEEAAAWHGGEHQANLVHAAPHCPQIYAYDAVWSIALALAAAERSVPNWLKEDCGSVNCHGAELMSLLKNNTFTGASGTIKFLAEVRSTRGLAVDSRPPLLFPGPRLSLSLPAPRLI